MCFSCPFIFVHFCLQEEEEEEEVDHTRWGELESESEESSSEEESEEEEDGEVDETGLITPADG